MKKENNNFVVGLIVLLVLVFFVGYWIMGFNGGIINWNYEFSWLFRVIAFIAAIWVIYDLFTNNKKLSNGMKLLWVILAVFFSIITAIVYYLVGRNSKNDLFKDKRKQRNKK